MCNSLTTAVLYMMIPTETLLTINMAAFRVSSILEYNSMFEVRADLIALSQGDIQFVSL